MAHYEETGQEIYDQCEGKVDYVIVGAGTGGTITGIGRKLKELIPGVKIIGVDPYSSLLAEPAEINKTDIDSYHVEGIGYDFNPRVIDKTVVDEWVKSKDDDSFYWARRLIKEEGLLVGGSSGSNFWAAMEFAKTLPEGKRVVVVLPDSLRNYVNKYISDDWLYENGFLTEVNLVV
jgi:cystathionine beta-synthase